MKRPDLPGENMVGWVVLGVVVLAVTSCGATSTDPADGLALPPADAGLDYQLGGASTVPDGVEIVARDRTEEPAEGVYGICYVNGFQTQPDEADWWFDTHPDLLLRDVDGEPVIDPDWPDEMLLDVSSDANRRRLAEIVGAWIDGCGESGFDAVEIDNLDTYARSDGRIDPDDAVAFIALLSDHAHGIGLPIGQKNSAEVLDRRDETGLDFAITEECNRYDECGDFTDAYGDQVFVIEYRASDFEQGCDDFGDLSIVLRDPDLVPAGEPGYVHDTC